MLAFYLSPHSGVAAYQQVIQQVKRALLLGQLHLGDQLPTVREVVALLALNPNTVLKAYRELELEGLVESRSGVGTFVVRVPLPVAPALLARLQRGIHQWVGDARHAGIDDDLLDALFQQALQRNEQEQAG